MFFFYIIFLNKLVVEVMWFYFQTAEEEDEQEDEDVEPLNLGADTNRVEEIPPKEPIFNAVPLKSALKKRPAPAASPAATPLATPLAPRQDHHHASFKWVTPHTTPPSYTNW